MLYKMVSNSRKKRLVSSYITWAFSKAKSMALFQALATIFFFKWNISGAFKQLQWFIAVMSLFDSLYLLQKGTTRGTLLALDHMRTDKGGKGGVIINISSAAGITLDAPISLASFYLKVFIISCEIYYLQV